MQNTPKSSSADRGSAVRRRTVLSTAAWSTPVLAVSTATPALAASTPRPGVNTIGAMTTESTVQRCAVMASGALRFQVYSDGIPTGVSGLVTVSLPDGLRFTGSGTARAMTLPTTPSGVVTVPAIQAVGSAGTYAVTATIAASTAFIPVTVTGTVSTVATLMAFSAATTSGTIGSIPDIATKAVSAEAYAFVDTAGTLSVSGAAFGIAATQPVAVLSDVATVYVDADPKTGAKLLAVTTSGEVLVSSTTSGRPQLAPATGYTGTVLDARAFYGAHYLVTTNGIYYGGLAYGDRVGTTLSLVPGSTGAQAYSFWMGTKSGKVTSGGAFLDASGRMVRFSGVQSAATVTTLSSAPPAQIRSLAVSALSILALDVNGRVWGQGTGYSASFANVYAQSGIGYSAMSSWSRLFDGNDFFGVTLLGTDGAVYQAMPGRTLVRVSGLQSVIVTRMFANDGIYQVLASDGSIWSWLGNNDWIGGVRAAQKSPLASPAGDFVAWSWHAAGGATSSDPSTFFGWGIALNQASCPLV